MLSACGVPLGYWTGLTGMGTSVLTGPLLVWLIALKDRRLAAVALISTVASCFFSLLAYSQAGGLRLGESFAFAVFSVIGAYVGALPALSSFRDNRLAAVLWALITLALGSYMIYGSATLGTHIGMWQAHLSIVRLPFPSLCGIGLASGLIGRLGNLGGVIAVPLLELGVGVPPLIAQGISIVSALLVSVLPTASYIARKEAPTAPSIWVTAGCALGALMGARHSVGLSAKTLILLYGAGMFFVGLIRLLSTRSLPQPKEITEPSEE